MAPEVFPIFINENHLDEAQLRLQSDHYNRRDQSSQNRLFPKRYFLEGVEICEKERKQILYTFPKGVVNKGKCRVRTAEDPDEDLVKLAKDFIVKYNITPMKGQTYLASHVLFQYPIRLLARGNPKGEFVFDRKKAEAEYLKNSVVAWANLRKRMPVDDWKVLEKRTSITGYGYKFSLDDGLDGYLKCRRALEKAEHDISWTQNPDNPLHQEIFDRLYKFLCEYLSYAPGCELDGIHKMWIDIDERGAAKYEVIFTTARTTEAILKNGPKRTTRLAPSVPLLMLAKAKDVLRSRSYDAFQDLAVEYFKDLGCCRSERRLSASNKNTVEVTRQVLDENSQTLAQRENLREEMLEISQRVQDLKEDQKREEAVRDEIIDSAWEWRGLAKVYHEDYHYNESKRQEQLNGIRAEEKVLSDLNIKVRERKAELSGLDTQIAKKKTVLSEIGNQIDEWVQVDTDHTELSESCKNLRVEEKNLQLRIKDLKDTAYKWNLEALTVGFEAGRKKVRLGRIVTAIDKGVSKLRKIHYKLSEVIPHLKSLEIIEVLQACRKEIKEELKEINEDQNIPIWRKLAKSNEDKMVLKEPERKEESKKRPSSSMGLGF